MQEKIFHVDIYIYFWIQLKCHSFMAQNLMTWFSHSDSDYIHAACYFFKAEYNLSVIWSNKSIVDLMRQFVSYIFPFRVNLNYHPCMNFAYTITLCFVNWNTYHSYHTLITNQ